MRQVMLNLLSNAIKFTDPGGQVVISAQLLASGELWHHVAVSTGRALAGLAIGGMVTLGALLGGPVSGASMNPVRSLAPAVVSGRLDHLWIYLTAPLVGAAVAVVACRCSRPAGCCNGRCLPESAV
jgi:glycerol uptake facilitator-like aquaporin